VPAGEPLPGAGAAPCQRLLLDFCHSWALK
jgi:hypothetical protein